MARQSLKQQTPASEFRIECDETPGLEQVIESCRGHDLPPALVLLQDLFVIVNAVEVASSLSKFELL
ncbi:MAG: hypothetical protein AB1899_00660 [Pseudomonadota bacterium]